MSRIFRSGEKNSHSAAIQAHTTPIQSVARMPSGAPQGTADQPAERQRAPHDPADGRVHPAEQVGRADQLPVAELSDVVDDEREGESGQRDREQDQPRTALGQRHENRDQAEHADRDPDDPGRPDPPGEPPRQHAAHDPAQAAEAEEQASVRGFRPRTRTRNRISSATVIEPNRFAVPVHAAILRSTGCLNTNARPANSRI